jgi:UDPglucose 6-dehydrogenase
MHGKSTGSATPSPGGKEAMGTRIGIIGHGIVGKGVEHVFSAFADRLTIHDKYQDSASLAETVENSEVVFICVPTPCNFTVGRIDLSIMDEVMSAIAGLAPSETFLVIKSTVVPGTTRRYGQMHSGLRIAMVPEFLREDTCLQDAENPSRIIIGADRQDVSDRLCALYGWRFPRTPLFRVSTCEAEIVKYMSNCCLAMRVVFANLLCEYARHVGADYGRIKQALTADPRIPDDHLDVTDLGGFGGKCFPKDLNALIGWAKERGLDTGLLAEVWRKNLSVRSVRDWEVIPGASSG